MDSGGAEGLPAIARENPLTEELRQELLAIDGVESITSHCSICSLSNTGNFNATLSWGNFTVADVTSWLVIDSTPSMARSS